jgi:surface protein
MLISQSTKGGKSADTGDLLAQRKRSILNQVIDSKKALGIYKPSLNSRGFEIINLRAQLGLDSLNSSNSSSVTPNVPVQTLDTDAIFTIVLASGTDIDLSTTGITSVEWGDGSTTINGGIHTYSPGTYTIKVLGTFTKFPTHSSFTPFISNVASFTNITDMSQMFFNNDTFNQDISGWDTSKVTNMSGMFAVAEDFNQDISNWTTSNVTNMSQMFRGTRLFDVDISGWNTLNVTDMSGMFSDAEVFNQNIGIWTTSNVTNMSNMFANALAFNRDLPWNTSSVTNMSSMFSGASVFNGNIGYNITQGTWNTSNVTDMSDMFSGASVFNQDISTWIVDNVTGVISMFMGTLMDSNNIAFYTTLSTRSGLLGQSLL